MLCPGNYIRLERQGKTYARLLYICYQTSDINGCLPALHHVTVTTLVSMECKRKQCQSDKVVPSHRCGFYSWNDTPCSCKKTLNRKNILRLHILCHFRATLGCYTAQLNRWWVIKSIVIHTRSQGCDSALRTFLWSSRFSSKTQFEPLANALHHKTSFTLLYNSS